MKTVSVISSTVPANGDVNPYGLALVGEAVGKLEKGNLLVSNFNDKANSQGTGTTIVQVSPAGKQSPFATVGASTLPGSCPGGVGLTTALSILPGRVCDRGKPPHVKRHVRHGEARLPDRARQQR
jgi:hypothetical protein